MAALPIACCSSAFMLPTVVGNRNIRLRIEVRGSPGTGSHPKLLPKAEMSTCGIANHLAQPRTCSTSMRYLLFFSPLSPKTYAVGDMRYRPIKHTAGSPILAEVGAALSFHVGGR